VLATSPVNYNFMPMDAARISTLLEPYIATPLPLAALDHISAYIDLLLRWNARTNLTAVRSPEEIVTRHFGESLFAARNLFPATNSNAPGALGPESSALRDAASSPAPLTFIDIGSGAGFPGIPIHMFVPGLRTTLIEAHHKKAAFLREVIRALTLTDIDVFAGRAQDFPATASLVTLRAVERFDQILPVAARLVSPSGRLALLISSAQISAAEGALSAFPCLSPAAIPGSGSRILLVATAPGPLGRT
jgi:16S rRNA (guanine527-N7)-methyltransferase